MHVNILLLKNRNDTAIPVDKPMPESMRVFAMHLSH